MAAKNLTLNEKIRAPQVRVISSDGEQLGIMKTGEALDLAYDKGFDLVEIAPTSKPPVCRIMDYGKYKFERVKREKESRKRQVTVEIKEVKFSNRIGIHDFDTKIAHAIRFLKAQNKVKMTIVFSGREMHNTSIGYKLMDKIAQACSEVGVVERRPSLDGRFMTMFVAPKTK